MTIIRSRQEREARLSEKAPHTFAMDAIVGALKEEPEYEQNGRNGITLVKEPCLSVVLEVLRQGARMDEHRAPGPITLQVLEGQLRFELPWREGEVIYLNDGELLSLATREAHVVEAVQDTAFLLSICSAG